jgi:threonine dehydratase
MQSERSGREILIDDLLKPERQPLKELVVICASAGNHGQGVAAGARLIGAP